MSKTILHESTCTWKSSCINSMGLRFFGPSQHNILSSTVLLLPKFLSLTLLRHHVCRVSAPCDCCVELCTAVLNCERITHGFPADQASVYRGCPDRDPLGCPLIPRQNGIMDKAPTLWLLQLLKLIQLLHACARDQHTFLDKLSQTHPFGQMYVDVDFDRFGLYCDAPHIFNCTRVEGSKVKVCPDCDFCVTTSNQLVVHEWLVLNHFCCCSRFDFSDILFV